ncbi:hypothetical protein HD598_000057 [Neomicrococcus aestuarii]|uniref:Uncharacterized protein n=2 Tax=Neomicrococcus aestuarii TaxID=556325 RepID=A0A7W8WYL8_9MICC|nr:hypothetical protein [Neomicrococcus aestuarii]
MTELVCDSIRDIVLFPQVHFGFKPDPSNVLNIRKLKRFVPLQLLTQRVKGLCPGSDLKLSGAQERRPVHVLNFCLSFRGKVVVVKHYRVVIRQLGPWYFVVANAVSELLQLATRPGRLTHNFKPSSWTNLNGWAVQNGL